MPKILLRVPIFCDIILAWVESGYQLPVYKLQLTLRLIGYILIIPKRNSIFKYLYTIAWCKQRIHMELINNNIVTRIWTAAQHKQATFKSHKYNAFMLISVPKIFFGIRILSGKITSACPESDLRPPINYNITPINQFICMMVHHCMGNLYYCCISCIATVDVCDL